MQLQDAPDADSPSRSIVVESLWNSSYVNGRMIGLLVPRSQGRCCMNLPTCFFLKASAFCRCRGLLAAAASSVAPFVRVHAWRERVETGPQWNGSKSKSRGGCNVPASLAHHFMSIPAVRPLPPSFTHVDFAAVPVGRSRPHLS